MKTNLHTEHFQLHFWIFAIFTTCLINSSVLAQGWQTITPEETYLCEATTALTETADGGFIAATVFVTQYNFSNIRLYKFDQDGTQLWTEELIKGNNIEVTDIILTSDGNYVISGTIDLAGTLAAYVVKVDQFGKFIWDQSNPDVVTVSHFEKIIETQDQGFVATGWIGTYNNEFDLTMKFDKNGTIEWSKTFSTSTALAYEVLENMDGTLIIVGKLRFYKYGFIIKCAVDGTLIWNKTDTELYQRFKDIIPYGDDYYILGENGPSLIKINKKGDRLWSASISYAGAIAEMHLSADQHLYLNGFNFDNGIKSGIALKIDTLGNLIWDRKIINNLKYDRSVLTKGGEFVCSGLWKVDQPNQTFNGSNFSIEFEYSCGNNGCPGGYCLAIKAVAQLPVGTAYGYEWSDGTVGATLQGAIPNQTYSVTVSGAFNTEYVGQITALQGSSNKLEVIKFDSTGQVFSNKIEGKLFLDDNQDCSLAQGETGITNWLISIDGDHQFSTYSDSLGNFSFELDSGSYDMTIAVPNVLFDQCQPSYPFTVSEFDTIRIDPPIKTDLSCPVMTLNVFNTPLRPCETAYYVMYYCNNGTKDASNVYINATFDSQQTVVQSTIPWSSQSGNTYTFQLGTVPLQTCGQITVHVQNSCTVNLGDALCFGASIYPDTLCVEPQSNWDGSITDLHVFCEPDSVRFDIKNIGISPMGSPQDYFVVEDNAILKNGFFQLDTGEVKEIKAPANGSTYRIYAGQAPGYFQQPYTPTAAIEGCGTNANGTFSTGFINQYPTTDVTSTSLDYCSIVVGPYDPNDKAAVPTGYGPEHYIWPNIDLDYKIRFQNVGTDTAFNVVIRDTLSEHLDVTSIQPGISSHPYQLDIVGANILKFSFNNIQLVDSTTNELGSHGFITYKISQKDSLPAGTMIYNSAAIYFDYEAPVITNQTWHEIDDNFNPSPYISLNVTPTNTSCFGTNDGSATAVIVGGIPPYQFNWSNGQSTITAQHLDAGDYELTVIDALGSVGYTSGTIEEPARTLVLFDVTNVSCDSLDDGSAIANNLGGIPPIACQWDASTGSQTTDTVNNLAVGVYQVTLTDANGCEALGAISIKANDCTEPCPTNLCMDAVFNNTDICLVLTNDPSSLLAAMDCDGDGVANDDECLDGTLPLDPCDFVDSNITLPVTADQSGCREPCPDLSPVLTILPGNLAGQSAVEVAIQISELDSVHTDGTSIIVRVPSDPRLHFIWDIGLTTVALIPVQNADWNYLGDNGYVHTFEYNGPGLMISADAKTALGFQAVYDPQATDGQTTLTVTILPFSGGECNLLNNTDAERLVYFE